MAQTHATSVVAPPDGAPAASVDGAPTATRPGPTSWVRSAVAMACWAAGGVSWAWAARIAAEGTTTGVGPVTSLYLTLAAGAAFLLVGTIARLPHGGDGDDDPWSETSDEARPALLQSLPDAVPGEAASSAADGVDEPASGQPSRAARSAEEMVAAYKRAAEKHSEQARQQQLRAEVAEARNRDLEAEIAGFEDGTSDAARVLHARIEAAAIVASNRRITEVTDASDRVIRALREEKALLEADRQAAREVIEGLERDRTRMLAAAATSERHRIQLLVRDLVAEYARTLPPDRARLAREQAEHFITAIRELPLVEAARGAEDQTSGPVVGGRFG